jgi:hypothetical protein
MDITCKLDLNIEKVLEDWSVVDALREFVSNALDEHTICKINTLPKIELDENVLSITDNGRGIKLGDFVIKANDEKKLDTTIGQYGYGLKDAIAYLESNKHTVTIDTKGYLFRFSIDDKHGTKGIKSYHCFYSNSNRQSGTKISVTNITTEDYDCLIALFLQYQKITPIFECNYGDVYIPDKSSGPVIYVQGLLVDHQSEFEFSYNIKIKDSKLRKAMNRERKSLSKSAYSDRVKFLLKKADGALLDRMISLYENQDKIKLKADLSYSEVKVYIEAKMKLAGKEIVNVTKKDLVKHHDVISNIELRGGKINIIPKDELDEMKSNLIEVNGKMSQIADIEKLSKNRKTHIDDTIEFEGLDQSEQNNYLKGKDLLDTITDKIGYPIFRIEVINGKMIINDTETRSRTICEDKVVQITRDILESPKTTMYNILRSIILDYHEYL